MIPGCRVWRATRITASWAEEPGLAARLAAADEAVDRAWEAACAERPLTNGRLLHIGTVEEPRPGHIALVGSIVQYRHYTAPRGGVALPAPTRPGGVSGRRGTRDGLVLLGRRADTVTQYPGWLELVPSGGVDSHALGADGAVDLAGCLLAELQEETGTPPAEVRELRPLGLVHDLTDDVYDAIFALHVSTGGSALREAMAGRWEYERVYLLEADGLLDRLAGLPELVPTSLAAARLLG